ncbi:DUF1206 domain-containing protein [Crossiella sp. CA198]|uniref:DUF1206 domain-containing protein n=1 Tax=Crossiella sp. CA198 TaxID=3455607 RepID=UPI003F8D4579
MVSTRSAEQGRQWVVLLGRIGAVCFGIVHLLVAWLAIQIAFGDSAGEADQKGALAALAEQPLGGVLLAALAAGLAFFAIWQLLTAVGGYRWLSGRRQVTKRISAAAHGFAAAVLTVVAVQLLSGSGATQGDQSQQEITGWLMSLPYGQFLVGVLALIVLGVGVAAAVKGIRRTFTDELELGRLPEGTQRLTVRLGQAGFVAKGVAYGVVGVLIGLAAINHDPKQAGGLDAALRTLADAEYGPYLLTVVGLGVAAFGIYCFAEARCHRA